MLINFKLFDGGGMFLLSEQITTIAVDHAGRLEAASSKVLEENNLLCRWTTKVKSAFFALLSAVIMSKRGDELKDVVFRRIKPGIDYLDNDPEQSLSIDRIAMLCGMSASLFRRIFAKYAGMSPLAYRNF